MSCMIRRYVLNFPQQTPSFLTLGTHASASFLKARWTEANMIEVWVELDDESPKADATFYFIREEEKVAKELASTLIHLDSVWCEGSSVSHGPVHLFCQIDTENFEWVLSAMGVKQITRPAPDKDDSD